MQELLNFMRDNWQWLSSLLAFLVLEIIVLITKKKPLSLDEFDEAYNKVLQLVPGLISLIEESVGPGSGSIKKEIVIDKALTRMEFYLHRDLTQIEADVVSKGVSDFVERVMASPQKKLSVSIFDVSPLSGQKGEPDEKS